MLPASAPYSSFAPPSLRRRATAFGLAIAIQLLILWVLLGLAPFTPKPPTSPNKPITFDLAPQREAAPKPTRTAAKKRASKAAAAARAPAAVTPPPPPPLPSEAPPLQMIVVSRDVFAAADIGRMPRRPSQPGTSEGAEQGRDDGAADGKGEGPGGERLYDADWERRPTRAELASYLPAGAPKGSWGMVACRTIPGNRVEDCRELADSQAGSGLARGVRQAAWQFRIRPPRVGGRALLGVWVRIRIDITDVKEADEGGR